MRFKSMQDDLVHLRDVAGAYGEDDVAMMRAHHHHLAAVCMSSTPRIQSLAGSCSSLSASSTMVAGVTSGEILLLLARGEDAGNDDVIGLASAARIQS